MIFEQICNSKWFGRTSMILFLNKIDLFQQKLRYSSLTNYFPDYKGMTYAAKFNIGDEKDYLQASRFFQKKFIRRNRSQEKEVYTHFTNATGISHTNYRLTCRYDYTEKCHGICPRHDYEWKFSTSSPLVLHRHIAVTSSWRGIIGLIIASSSWWGFPWTGGMDKHFMSINIVYLTLYLVGVLGGRFTIGLSW